MSTLFEIAVIACLEESQTASVIIPAVVSSLK